MQVILLHDVPKVGRKYDVVDIADGYAMNFLVPQKLAERATAARVRELAARREAAQAAEDAARADLREKLAALKDTALTITAKADDQGHLYKKVHADDIASALADEHDVKLPRGAVLLDNPLHEVGDHTVHIEAADTKLELTVQVVAE